jgi:GT2 family glycosyltransferase
MNPDLSVIIVSYDSGEDLPKCLEALENVRDELRLEIIVVDNQSSDGSAEAVQATHPDVLFIRADRNLGFAAGCNLGLGIAQGRHAMLLNPDTEVLPGALKRLVEALDTHPSWGMVGPSLMDSSGHQYRAARRFPTPYYLFCESTRLAFFFPRSRLFGAYFYGDRTIESLDQVDQLEGSALVISGSAREAVGNLDSRFFLYFEEVDWCRRVKEAGYEIHVVHDAVICHHRSSSVSQHFLEARVAHAESAMKYFSKYHGEAGLRPLRRWIRLGLWVREWGMRVASILGGGERVRVKAQAAHRERAVYRRGLQV